MAPTSTATRPEELRLKVTGMSCAGCAASVQKALEASPGVSDASVSVTEGLATILGRNLQPNVLIQAIEARGFGAESLDESPSLSEKRSEIELRQAQSERQWRFRAIVGLSVWAPLEALHWIGRIAGWHGSWMDWLMLIGATAVVIVAGGGFYRSAWRAAMKRTTNMDTLIAIGATTAYVFSLIVFIAQFLGRLGGQQLYFTEAAALLGIISLGHWMEARAAAKAGSAVRELLELQPDEAEILDDSGNVRTKRSADVEEGDRLLIRPGGRVPVDGEIVEGESELDESIVTGESAPVYKQAGDQVVAGSMNTTGRLIVAASVDGRHTTISRIADMVQRAQSSKAEIQRLADRVSAIFVPVVLAIALATFVGWWIFGDVATGVISTVTVLIISCPCALGLATPMAVMVGAGAASRRGILVKSAAALETAGRATIVVFDKTGTLTAGRPTVRSISIERGDEGDALRLAAAVEAPSEHPIARAIVDAARQRDLKFSPVSNFRAIPGEGVRGEVNGRSVAVLRDERAACRLEVNGETIARFEVEDAPRPDAKRAVEALRAMGIRPIMLTGDSRAVAERIGNELGFAPDEIEAEATPESKTRFVEELTKQTPNRSSGVIMVGDGINDAAALARADLGIAMASGTNVAIESADVVIPGDHVTAVVETIQLARLTLRTIKQNLFFAFFYNAAAIPAAAFGLLGPFGPLIAAAAMGFSDMTVIGNALRMKAKLAKQ